MVASLKHFSLEAKTHYIDATVILAMTGSIYYIAMNVACNVIKC